MRRLILIQLIIVFGVAPTIDASPPAHFWSQSHGGTRADDVFASAVDAAGNVYIAGGFEGTTDLGGGPLVSAGKYDFFLAKYDANGIHQWSQRYGGTANDYAHGVTVDASGNVYMTGEFAGAANFGGGALISAGFSDIVVAKYDTAGAHQWSRRFGSTGFDLGRSVAIDASGNVFVSGQFQVTVSFGGGALVSAGLWDIFLAKYDTAGTHQWSQRFGTTSHDYLYDVASDGSSLFITGYFSNTVDFGGGGLVSAGAEDVYLAKYEGAAGAHQWSQRLGGTDGDYAYGVAVDDAGGVFITGEYTSANPDFGGVPLPSAIHYDMFAAKYDASTGAHLWSHGFAEAGYQRGSDLALDSSGNVFVGGWMAQTVDFGGGPLTSVGRDDACLAKFDTDGNHVWSANWGSTLDDYTVSVVVDPSDNVIISASFQVTADFGGGPLTSLGGVDVALVKYAGSTATGVGGTPPGYVLSVNNYPNPFNPSTTVKYTVPSRGVVTVEIYDVRGSRVASLVSGEHDAGSYATHWAGLSDAGAAVSSGVYFARIEHNGTVRSKKMVVLK